MLQGNFSFNGSNKGSSHSQRHLPITLKKIKFTDICCRTNFVNTIFYSRYWKRIGLCHIIDFSVFCTKSKCSIWFWHQNTGEIPAAIAGFYYPIYCISFWRCSTLYGLNLWMLFNRSCISYIHIITCFVSFIWYIRK